jgi:hypothetical protein
MQDQRDEGSSGMDRIRALSLLSRQLAEIDAQADRIVRGESTSEALGSFARFSSEMKAFIRHHFNETELAYLAIRIPEINYKRNRLNALHYLLFPYWWVVIVKEYYAKQRTISEIVETRGKYASLALRVTEMISH